MDITFLIGNGFDIRMGIASAYKKVEAHYIGLDKTDPCLQSFQQSMSNNGDHWSNFESAIGQYTIEFSDDGQSDFQICLNDFTDELIQYLEAEEAKVDYDLCSEEIQKEFFRSISEYDADIAAKYRNELHAIIAKNGGVNFRFISFNYTRILDQCLQRSFDEKTVVGKHVMNNTNYNHLVDRNVFHIHGCLPGPIILGVDNTNQISNKKWADQRRFQQKIAKPAMNARAGSLIDSDVSRTIKGSNIICIYGMSLGETDKTWWKLIGSWLYASDHRLIIYGHNSNYSRTAFTHQRQFTIQDELIDRFLDMAEIPEKDKSTLENKIFAVINPDLFNINLVDLTQQKKKIDNIEKEARKKELMVAYDKHQKLSEV